MVKGPRPHGQGEHRVGLLKTLRRKRNKESNLKPIFEKKKVETLAFTKFYSTPKTHMVKDDFKHALDAQR